MWNRKELKTQAKERMRRNYWRCVLAALLLYVIGLGAGVGGTDRMYSRMQGDNETDYEEEYIYEENVGLDEVLSRMGEVCGTMPNGEFDEGKAIALMFFIIFFLMIFFIVLAVVVVIVLPLEIFIVNPLEIGIRRFFVKNLKGEANFREVCFAFDHHYKNTVKIMFFRGLYVFLWSLLFLIPGIIKAYEYRMVPYLIQENPEIEKEEAFSQSRFLMEGNRWKAFVLDLSFLGWYILSGMTLGILGVFYVNPYAAQTKAALYQKLKEQKQNIQRKEIPYQG